MAGDPESDKLDELAARIRQAGAGYKVPRKEGTPKPGDSSRASRPAIDFAASVVACALLGWFIDYHYGSAPWGIVIMIFVGFAVGLVNIWRAMQKLEKQEPKT